MVVALWSAKGGAGVTSVAALLAIGQAERAQPTVVVDLCGDVATVLGGEQPVADTGVAEWLALESPTAATLARIEHEARLHLSYVARGSGSIDAMVSHLRRVADDRLFLVDCGVIRDRAQPEADVVAAADQSLLVTRECFLHLRAVQLAPVRPTGVIVIKEPGRHLGRPDVEAAAGAPVIAELAIDRSVSGAIDSGLVQAHLPRRLVRTIARVLADAA